jgi:DNA helicase-2/ATP-dependent DNA helicase PcrA
MTDRMFAIFGPPGTGKTKRLSIDAENAAMTYGNERVLITSLTKAAAHEIRGRVDIPEGNVATLHSLCYRGLGRPELATSKDNLEEWNETHGEWRLTPKDEQGERLDGQLDDREGKTDADAALEEIDLNRHLKRDVKFWKDELLAFHHAWTTYKREHGFVDFTDMIDLARAEVLMPPGDFAVQIVDEAQDLSPLEMDVIHQWSRHVKTTVLAGDADQWLYEWRGADPILFKPGGIAPEQTRILSQSYRVPKAAFETARSIIRGCANRIDVEYRPTEVEGSVELSSSSFLKPFDLVDMAEQHTRDISLGTLMLIAPCGYHLNPVLKQLRRAGIPFHNPYKSNAGHWNPIVRRKNATTTAERILAFTHLARTGQPWSAKQFKAWGSGIKADGVLVKGVKAKLMQEEEFRPPQSKEDLLAMFESESHAAHAVMGDLEWYRDHCISSMADRLAFPTEVYNRFGAPGLRDTPRVIVGTIHSVKGGEADVVAVSPDLSPSGMHELGTNPDYMRRLMYVACTRTKRELILCRASRPGMEAGLW